IFPCRRRGQRLHAIDRHDDGGRPAVSHRTIRPQYSLQETNRCDGLESSALHRKVDAVEKLPSSAEEGSQNLTPLAELQRDSSLQRGRPVPGKRRVSMPRAEAELK